MIDKQRQVQHFFLRAGFGQPYRVVKKAMEFSREEVVQKIFKASEKVELLEVIPPNILKRKTSKLSAFEFRVKRRKYINVLIEARINQLAATNGFLRSKMALFWDNHFASTIKSPKALERQINLINKHALGNFEDLVMAVCKDAVMINYLSLKRNKKGKPNENFAREVMELFTLGIGNYTEMDIKEAARAFTGWSHKQDGQFIFRKNLHDSDEKVFLGRKGNFNGDDIIKILLEQKQTAHFLCSKIFRYFVNEKEDPIIIQKLADSFYQSGYNIKELMYQIFTSDWFYDSKNIGTKIKSPVELLAGLGQTLDIEYPEDGTLLFLQKALGQVLFHPPNVAGWSGGEDWIDGATLMLRLQLPLILFESKKISIKNKLSGNVNASLPSQNELAQKTSVHIDWNRFEGQFTTNNKKLFAEELTSFLYQTDVPSKTLTNFRKLSYKKILIRALQLPEFQLC